MLRFSQQFLIYLIKMHKNRRDMCKAKENITDYVHTTLFAIT